MEREDIKVIPRLKPYLGREELSALFSPKSGAVEKFEKEFAQEFDQEYAVAFSYGRTAIWAFLKALEIENAEVIQPAYTCSVVAHATYLSGNIPVFVDCTLTDYNMDLDAFEKAFTKNTRVVIPTHLFGYAMDINHISEIVQSAENKFGHKIWVLQDCAHSFDARFQGQSVISNGDGAVFGLNISKQITSVFGGMFTTSDSDLAEKIHTFRQSNFSSPGFLKQLQRILYLLAVYPAFNSSIYGLVHWLQEKTPFLNGLTKAYHLDEKIHFPPDYTDKMAAVEANVGIQQVRKYQIIQKKRMEIADRYFDALDSRPDFILPPKVTGATYSHFPIMTNTRDSLISEYARRGVQVGQLIEYSMPHHPAYISLAGNESFPNALLCSQSMINLPIHPGLTENNVEKIIAVTKSVINNSL